jgi:hypothetical protein
MLFLRKFLLLTLIAGLVSASACQQVSVSKDARARSIEPTTNNAAQEAYGPPVNLGYLQDKAIDESSGLTASRTSPGNYWTHNDSGNGPVIYAFNSKGERRGVWRVTGATSDDWESMSSGPGPKPGVNYLYIGDIGDNTGNRSELVIWRIPEPVIPATDTGSTEKKSLVTEPAEAIRLRYPDGKHDSEALLIHPTTGRIFLVLKVPLINPGVYAADVPNDTRQVVTLKRIGEVDMPGFLGGIVTDGDISPDGSRLALCDYVQGYELVLKDPKADFDSIWKQPVETLDIGKRKHGETITYRLDGKAILATSERLPTPLFEIVRK